MCSGQQKDVLYERCGHINHVLAMFYGNCYSRVNNKDKNVHSARGQNHFLAAELSEINL